ncbi:MAG: hypothetical protein ACYSUC_00630 [Planctomycetota bacterium]
MKDKWVIPAVLGALLFLVLNPAAGAVNTAEIDRVRDKNVLTSGDFQVIDDFIGEALKELVRGRQPSSVVKARMLIEQRKTSNEQSAKAQYARQFSESAYRYISEALRKAKTNRDLLVTVNLLILIDRLVDMPENLRLVDLSIGMLRDDNKIIQYVAVQSVTNPGIIRQLKKGDNSDLAGRIAQQLKGLVDNSSSETIALMAEFAGGVEVAEADALLLQVAEMRMKKYVEWAVEYALLDTAVLQALCSKMSSAGASKPEIARHFAQLYSYIAQRYVKGQSHLSDADKERLISVLVETERSCVGPLLGRPQGTIRRALEREDMAGFLLEINKLLGDRTGPGALGRKFLFDYGKNPDGGRRIEPLVLADPPKIGTSQ